MVGSAANRDKGADGNRQVATVLDALPAPFRVLHDLDLPGAKVGVDHLVIGPGGLFAVVAEHADGRVSIRKDTLLGGRRSLGPQLDRVKWACRVFSDRLNQPVEAVVCLIGHAPEPPVAAVAGVTATALESLNGHLMGQPTRLNEREIALVAERAGVLVRRTAPGPAAFGAGTALGGTGSSSGYHASPAVPTVHHHLSRRGQPAARPRRIRRSFASVLWEWLVRLIVLAMVVAGLVLLITFINRDIDKTFDSLTTQTTRPPITIPGAATPETPGSTSPATAATVEPVKPTISFDCPTRGAGWVASAGSTTRRTDSSGYHLWYRIGSGSWIYWGEFRNGVSAPPPLRHLDPGTRLTVGVDRTKVDNPARIAEVTEYTAPDGRC